MLLVKSFTIRNVCYHHQLCVIRYAVSWISFQHGLFIPSPC